MNSVLFSLITCAWLLELVIHRPDRKRADLKSPAVQAETSSLWFILAAIIGSITLSVVSGQLHVTVIHISGTEYIGLLLYAIGVGLRWWGIQELGRAFSRHVKVSRDMQLVSSGPYRFMCHPLYTGILLALIGIALTQRTWLGFVGVWVLIFPLLLFRIRIEERAMHAELGEPYIAWKKQRWRMIPFVY